MKKVIIVGATSGIGKELAILFAENNYLVGITGRRTKLLEELKAENPEKYLIKTFDITETNTSTIKLQELVFELGGLDMIVISSGTGEINEQLDFNVEKQTIDTNISGFTCIADWAFRYFNEQKSGQIVAITSIGGLRGSGNAPAYNASKAYQINYMEGLRKKANKLTFPIHITDIRPGLVDTDMAKGDGLLWVMPVKIATKQIYSAIRNKKKVAYVTKRWRIVAFIMKHLPRFIYDQM